MKKRSLFYKKLFCSLCGSSYKAKRERGKTKYVCSKYDNFGECERNVVEEEYLLDLLRGRYGELPNEELVEKVIEIQIQNKILLEIKLTDQENIKFTKNHIVY